MSGAPIDYPVTAVADRMLTAATTAFLFLAPFSGSAGLRGACLVLAAFALCLDLRARLVQLRDTFPRAVLVLFACWAALALASLAWSVQPAYTRAELRPEMLYTALAFVAFFLAARAERWRLWWIALFLGTAMSIAGSFLQDVLPFFMSRHSIDGGPGHLSTHLVIVTPLLFALVWPRPWGMDRGTATLVAALALMVGMGWLTENRMIWAALGAQLLVGIAAWRSSARVQAIAAPPLARVTLAAGLIVVAAFATSVVERGDRALRLASPASSQLERDLRPRIWAVAAERVREAPWLGHGFGREILAASFLPITPRDMRHPDIRHAHNMFLDVLLQLGVVGLAVFTALLVALAREHRLLLADPRVAPLGVMGLAILAGFVVKNLTDDFLYRHNALVFWAINGALLGLARAARRAP